MTHCHELVEGPRCTTRATVVGVVIADDHERRRRGLACAVRSSPRLRLLGEAANSEDALGLIGQVRPDVATLDLRLPVVDAARLLDVLSRGLRRTQVLFFSPQPAVPGSFQSFAHTVHCVATAIRPSEMVDAILAAAARGLASPTSAPAGDAGDESASLPFRARLSAREIEVLQFSSIGWSAKQVAYHLGIRHATVTTLLARASEKLGASSKTQAVAVAIRAGLL